MPFYPRGCYLSIKDRGRLKDVLEGYAAKYMQRAAGGKCVAHRPTHKTRRLLLRCMPGGQAAGTRSEAVRACPQVRGRLRGVL